MHNLSSPRALTEADALADLAGTPRPDFNKPRELKDHQVNLANDTLTVEVLDQPGSGGAHHAYRVSGFELARNPSAGNGQVHDASTCAMMYFQNGPIPESGVNGITHEVLLAIVADRLRCFQAGPFANKANACALTHIEEAMHWLHSRTLERMRRGVEGTHKV